MDPRLGINESDWKEILEYIQKNRAINKDMKTKILQIVWKQLSSSFGNYIANQTCPECFEKINNGEIKAPEVETFSEYDGHTEACYRNCIHCDCKVYF